MVKLRSNVFVADKDNGNVEAALEALQAYVVSHMNTNISGGPNAVYPPIQLTYTYERLQQAADVTSQDANAAIYTDAQHYCEQQDPVDFSGHNRVPCIEQYVLSHGVQAPTVPANLYEFDFISPTWSPDLAGWSLVVSIVLFITFVGKLALDFWLKRLVA